MMTPKRKELTGAIAGIIRYSGAIFLCSAISNSFFCILIFLASDAETVRTEMEPEMFLMMGMMLSSAMGIVILTYLIVKMLKTECPGLEKMLLVAAALLAAFAAEAAISLVIWLIGRSTGAAGIDTATRKGYMMAYPVMPILSVSTVAAAVSWNLRHDRVAEPVMER